MIILHLLFIVISFFTVEAKKLCAVITRSCTPALITPIVGSPYTTQIQPQGVSFSSDDLFVSVANTGSDSIRTFSCNPSTGSLTFIGDTAVGSQPVDLDYHLSRRFIAVICQSETPEIQIYATNPSTGSISSVPVSTQITGILPVYVKYSPSGRFVSVANNGSNTISIYSVDYDTGVITPLVTSPETTGINPVSISYSPNERFVAVANNGSNNVTIYNYNTLTGDWTDPANFGTDISMPSSLAFSPLGTILAVTNFNTNTIAVFSVDPSTGALTPVPGSPFITAAGPSSISFSATGLNAIVSNAIDGTISYYSVDSATGTFNLLSISPAGSYPQHTTYSTLGKFIAVSNKNSNTLSIYTSNLINEAMVPLGTTLSGSGPASIAFNINNRSATVVNFSGSSITKYNVNSDTGDFFDAITQADGSQAFEFRYMEHGQFGILVNRFISEHVTSYFVNPITGNLAIVSTSPAGSRARSVDIAPSGIWAAAANEAAATIFIYHFNPLTGALSAVSSITPTTGTLPFQLDYSPDSRFLALVTQGDNTLRIFAVNQATGILTLTSLIPTSIVGTAWVVFSPDNRFVAVGGNNAISMFSINSSTGTATAVLGSPFAAVGTFQTSDFSTDGRYLVSAGFAGEVALRSVDPTTGVLTLLGNVASSGTQNRNIAYSPDSRLVADVVMGTNLINRYKIVDLNICSPADGSLLNTPTITLTGTSDAGDIIEIYIDNVLSGTTITNVNGNWIFNTPALANGIHNFFARVNNLGGTAGRSTRSNIITVTIDTIAPSPPIITSPVTGTITNNNMPTFVGTAEANSTITIYQDGNPIGTTLTDVLGNWSFTTGTPIPDGTYTFTATATDRAGNISDFSNQVILTIDTIAPSPPIITSPINNSIINNSTPAIRGIAEPNTLITTYINGVASGKTLTNGAGTWIFIPAAKLPDGTYTFTATATDRAGNISGISNAVSITIDTNSPATPIITLFPDISNSLEPIITGKAEPNAIITAFANGKILGFVRADSTGSWIFSPEEDLTNNTYAFAFTATDEAGNISSISKAIIIRVDQTACNPPTINSVSQPVNFITGSAKSNSIIFIFIDKQFAGTTKANRYNNWAFKISGVFADNTEHIISIIAVQTNGLKRQAADVKLVLIDKSPIESTQSNLSKDIRAKYCNCC